MAVRFNRSFLETMLFHCSTDWNDHHARGDGRVFCFYSVQGLEPETWFILTASLRIRVIEL